MDPDDIVQQLSPEEMQQLLSLGTMPERQQQLQQQLLQAQVLREGPGESQHTSPMGALFHGIAGAGASLAGGLRENQLQGQLQGLQDQQVGGRQLLLQKLLGGRQQQPSAPGAGDVQPSPFGFG